MKETKLSELMRNLEKIGKIAILRLEKEYTEAVLEDILWIENNFIDLLKLRKKNRDDFLKLINPRGDFTKKSQEPIDWSKVTLDDIQFVSLNDSDDENDKNFQKKYWSVQRKGEENILEKYFDVIYSIFFKAKAIDNFQVQRSCLYVYGNWISILTQQEDPEIDFDKMIKYFLEVSTSLNREILESDHDRRYFSSRFLSFNLYLNIIFSENRLSSDKVNIYFDYLFKNLHLALFLNQDEIIKRFISRCIDSHFLPSSEFTLYSDLYLLISRRENELELDEQMEFKSKIMSYGYDKLRYLKTTNAYSEWVNDFEAFLLDLEKNIPFNDEISAKVKEIKELALKYLYFNLLQANVIKVMSYALFKNQSELVFHAFNYNTPGDTSAIWGNREILPESIDEIFNYLLHSSSIVGDLLPFWEGHHDVEPYLDRFFLLIFYDYSKKNSAQNSNRWHRISNFCKGVLDNEIQDINSLIWEIEALARQLTFHHENSTSFAREYLTNEELVSRTITLFEELVSSLRQFIDLQNDTGEA
jgi:hypothetical protein